VGLPEDVALAAARELAVLAFSSQTRSLAPGGIIRPGIPQRLVLGPIGDTAFGLDVPASGRYVLFTQHRPEEFEARFVGPEGLLAAESERTFEAGHSHDDEVTSVGIARVGTVDPKKLSAWMSRLLREQGVDIFRTKGILNLQGEARRYVFQGVHMLFDGNPDRPWKPEEERLNQLVFIGRNLDREQLEKEFAACLV
jgi:G3E family GTPase